MNLLSVSLWGDEAFSVLLSLKNIPDIITTTAHDTAPPFYYIVLHFWMKIFGTSEIAVRSLSVLCFLLLAIVVYFFIKEFFSKRQAILASVFILGNPFLFLYAFEARMYMLVTLLVTLSFWFLLTKRWIWYIVATTLALYSHHFALFIVVSQIPAYLVLTVQKQDIFHFLSYLKNHKYFILSLFAIFVLYAPWIPVLISQSSHVVGDFWLGKPTTMDLVTLYATFVAGGSATIISLVVLLISSILLLVRGVQKKIDLVFYIWFLFPPLFTFLISLVSKPLFFNRYLIVSCPAVAMLLATSFSETKVSTYFKTFHPNHHDHLVPSKLKDNPVLSRSNILRPTQDKKPGMGGFAIASRLKRNTMNVFYLRELLLIIVVVGLFLVNYHTFTHPNKKPFRELSGYIKKTYGNQVEVVNYYTQYSHYFELKYYGIKVKLFSKDPLPFWIGKSLITNQDMLTKLPDNKQLVIMASGDVSQIIIPGYRLQSQTEMDGLYVFQYNK